MNNKIVFILIILIGICAISHVSAQEGSDLIDDNITSIDDSLVGFDLNDEQNCLGNASEVHYVNSGSDIQQAVDTANKGDTLILNGSFKLDTTVTINKTLNISGSAEGARVTLDGIYRTGLFIVTSEASNVIFNNVKFISGDSNMYGGAIFWQGDNGSITNCEFSKNMANEYGGALVITGNNCNITNCTFSKNHVNQYGGAVLLNGDNCNLVDCIFTENYASFYGGAIVVNGRNNLIYNCEFNGNYVSKPINGSSIVGGGAIYSACEDLTIDKSTFKNNHANESYGGAIRFDSHAVVQNSSFNGNFAILGDDIYGNAVSTVMDNYFVLDYNENEQESVYGEKVIKVNNVFNKTKIDSSITFVSAGMVFDYGQSGTIHVNVNGGTIGSIQILKHPEAIIKVSNNVVTVSNLAVGTYTLSVTSVPDSDHTATTETIGVTVRKATAVIKASKITVALKNGASWKIKIVNSKTGKGISGLAVTLKVYTGKKFKKVTLKTNSNGEATYQTRKLSKGNHRVVVSASDKRYNFNSVSSSIKVVKQKKLKFKMKFYKNKDSSTVMFRVYKGGKPVNGIKLNLLFYTGKKLVKTVKLKSKTFKKNKGLVGYTTNELSPGKHKIVLKPASIKYGGSKKGTFKLTKKQTQYPAVSSKI